LIEKQQSVKMITNTDLLPQRYHFLLGMVKDLNVFQFDNDMKKAHFGTKLCIYHEKTESPLISNHWTQERDNVTLEIQVLPWTGSKIKQG
jgi:hypothetical protein